MFAETAYLFRHAMLRDAAYQLHLPMERAALHALALDLLEGVLAGSPELADPWAEEMASHAAGAQHAGLSAHELAGLARRQSGYLQVALKYLFSGGRNDGALAAARALLALGALDDAARVNVLRLAGECSMHLGDLANAAQSLELASQGDDSIMDARAAMRSLGAVLMRRQQPDLAQETIGRAIESCRRHGDRANHSRALGALGVLYMFTGRTDLCERTLQEALDIQHQMQDHAAMATTQANLANLYVQQGRTAEALELFNRAEQTFTQGGIEYHLALLLANRAVLHQNFGRNQEALRDHNAAAAGVRRAGDRSSEARVSSNLGLLLLHMGQTAQGVAHIRRALELARETGDRLSEALALLHLGTSFIEDCLNPEGLACLSQSLAAFQAQGDKRLAGVALINIAEVRLARGEIDAAIQDARQATELERTVPDPLWEQLCRIFLARVTLLLGDTQAAMRQATEIGQVMIGLGAANHALEQADAVRLRCHVVLGELEAAQSIHARMAEAMKSAGASSTLAKALENCGGAIYAARTGASVICGFTPIELGPQLVAALSKRGLSDA